MATLTPNYGLSMPEATDDFKDFRASYNSNMGIIDNNLGGGGGGGGHTIVDENGSDMPAESKLQFTGNVSVTDDNVNGRTVVDILGGGGANYGFAIDENNKLFEGTINNFNQSLSYTATEDAIALCYFRGGAGTWQFLSINGVYIRLYGDGTNQAVSYSVPIRKGDVVASRSESYSESCYFLLSVYGIKQGTSGIFAPVIYSDTERKIGIWRDNKPLYAKTLNPSVNVGSNTLNHGIANLEKCVRIYGVCKYNNTNEQLPLPYVSTNTAYAIACGNVTPTNYLVDVGAGFGSIQECYITFFYTKTTDVAGSGNWNTDGVPTVHYDTTEKVIGTYLGKPLYKRTWDNLAISITANTWANTGISATDIDVIVDGTMQDDNKQKIGGTIGFMSSHTYIEVYPQIGNRDLASLTVLYTKTTD